jgi:AcrR family transcriptional regulator
MSSTDFPEDPRIRRTKRRLRHALLELVDETGYEAITVERLTERADVARSTFYAHFGSKDDLLFDGVDTWLLSFRTSGDGPMPGERGGFTFSLPLLRHVRSRKGFFQETIMHEPAYRLRRRLAAILSRVAAREMGWDAEPDSGNAARSRAAAGAFLALLEWWFENDTRLGPEEVDRIFQDAYRPGGAGADRRAPA